MLDRLTSTRAELEQLEQKLADQERQHQLELKMKDECIKEHKQECWDLHTIWQARGDTLDEVMRQLEVVQSIEKN